MLAEVGLRESGPVDPAVLGAEPHAAAVIHECAGHIASRKGESVSGIPLDSPHAGSHEVVSPHTVCRREPEPSLPLEEAVQKDCTLRKAEKTAY